MEAVEHLWHFCHLGRRLYGYVPFGRTFSVIFCGGVASPSNGKITVFAGNRSLTPDVNTVYMMKQMIPQIPRICNLLILFTFSKLAVVCPMRDNMSC